MNKTPASKPAREKKQEWPFIRWSPAENKWKVDARTKDGGSRRFFDTKSDAETFAQQCRVTRTNSGTSAFGNAELAAFGKTPSDAIAFYLAYLRESQRSVSLSAAVSELIELKKKAGSSVRYCRDLKNRLGQLEETHGKRLVSTFTTAELDEWLAGLDVAPGTRNAFRKNIRTLFSFCRKRKYRSDDPAKETEFSKGDDAPASILTPEQAGAILTACDDEILPYMAIAIFAGLRAAELQKLDWSEVDLESGHIEVTAAKSKTRRRRLVPISTNLADWIRPLVKRSGPVAPPVGLRRKFDIVKAAAGFEEWPGNAMRHSFGSYRLAECHDAAKVSLEMGNSPAMVFAHYRELVKPKEAAKFWALAPSDDAGGKIVGIQAA